MMADPKATDARQQKNDIETMYQFNHFRHFIHSDMWWGESWRTNPALIWYQALMKRNPHWSNVSMPPVWTRVRLDFHGDGNGVQSLPIPEDHYRFAFRAPYVAPAIGYKRSIEYVAGYGFDRADESVRPPRISFSASAGYFMREVPLRFAHRHQSVVFRIRSQVKDLSIYRPHPWESIPISATRTAAIRQMFLDLDQPPGGGDAALVGCIDDIEPGMDGVRVYVNQNPESRRLEHWPNR